MIAGAVAGDMGGGVVGSVVVGGAGGVAKQQKEAVNDIVIV